MENFCQLNLHRFCRLSTEISYDELVCLTTSSVGFIWFIFFGTTWKSIAATFTMRRNDCFSVCSMFGDNLGSIRLTCIPDEIHSVGGIKQARWKSRVLLFIRIHIITWHKNYQHNIVSGKEPWNRNIQQVNFKNAKYYAEILEKIGKRKRSNHRQISFPCA